jgi:glycosyltransferase involved in cell wall biosynthesis
MKTTKKLRILFDANPLAQAGKSGVGYYTEGVVRALAETYPDSIELVGHYYNFLGRKNPSLPLAPNIRYRRTTLIPGKIIYGLRKLGVFIPFEVMARTRADIILFPNYFAFPSLFGTPIFATIHDTYFMVKAEEVSPRNAAALKRFVPHAIKLSRKVLTVSEFSKREIQTFFGAKPEQIIVTPIPPTHSHTLEPSQAAKLLERFKLTTGYILFLGNIEPRKNIVNLVRAYRLLPQQFKQAHQLVLAGGKGWQDDEIITEIQAALAANEPIIQTGYVSDDERTALYQNAVGVIMPSKYEGFGMQLLEAMTYHKPILASDLPVFHEVAGDSAIYFDHESPEAIRDAMLQVENHDLIEDMLIKQRENLRHFSWPRVATDLYGAFLKALSK